MRQCMDADNLHRRLKKIIGQVQAIRCTGITGINCSVCIGENFAAGEVFLVQYSIKAA